jgi:putative MATE family efflux protein
MFSALEVVDMFWIGKLGKVAIAGVVLSANFSWVLSNLMVLVGAGVLAMVARNVGAGNKHESNRIASQGVIAALILGLLCALITIMYAKPLLGFYGAEPDVARAGVRYFRIIMAAFPLGFVMITVGQAIRASGDTRTPMIVGGVSNIINMVLDPFLIFGWLFFPRLGLDGAAIATLLARFVGMFLGLYMVLSGRTPINIFTSRFYFIPDMKVFWRFFKIGVPAFIGDLTRPLTSILMFKIVAVFGTAAIASFGVGYRALAIGFIFLGGVWTATSTLVGHFLGRGSPEKSLEVTNKALILGFAIQVFLTAIYCGFAEYIIMIFNTNPEVVRHGANYLRLISLGQLVSVMGGVYGSAFRGVGDTKPPMYNAIFVNWFIKIPLAILLSLPLMVASTLTDLLGNPEAGSIMGTCLSAIVSALEYLKPVGVSGVWIGIMASIIIEALILFFWFRRGKWVEKKI